RGVRATAPGRGWCYTRRGGDAGRKNALASDLDDLVRFYSRRSAAHRGERRRVRDAAISRDRCAVRDARGHGFRPRVYARLLHSHSQARHQEGSTIQNLQPIVRIITTQQSVCSGSSSRLARSLFKEFAIRPASIATNPTLMRCVPKTLKSLNSMLSTTA